MLEYGIMTTSDVLYVNVKCQLVIYCYSQNLDGVCERHHTARDVTYAVNGDTDALVRYDVDRSTASDLSGLITRPF